MIENEGLKENLKKEELKKEKGGIFLKIAKTAIYLLVFLLPLFFLPWTVNALEFNKQALLFFLVLISLIAWLVHILTSYKLEINKSFINLPVILLVLATLLSVIFSLFSSGSFWGWPLSIAPSFLSLLSFAVFYFIIVNLFKREEIPFLLLTLFVSGGLTALIFIFHFFGKFIFPFDFARLSFFNTVGAVKTLAIYFVILLLLLLPLLFFVKRFFKIILGIFGLVLLFSLFLINSWTAWLIFLTGSVVLFTLGTVGLKKTRYPAFITFLMTFLIIGIIFTFFRFSLPGVPAAPLETLPGQLDSFKILTNFSPKELIMGTGPGTFFYDWARHRPAEINQTVFWQTRFPQPASEIFERLISAGILGFLAFLFLLAVCLKSVFSILLAKMQSDNPKDVLDRFLLWGVLAGFVGLILAFFLYPANLSILFLFWLLIAFSVLLREEPSAKFWRSVDLQTPSFRTMTVSFLAVLVFVFGIGLAILYSQRYLAEVKYYQGLRAWQKGEAETSSNFISKATDFNPKIDLYWRDLSQVFLFRLQTLLSRTDLNQEEMTSQAQTLISNAIGSANRATEIDPKNAVNWNIRAFIYQNLIGTVGGDADIWALRSYEEAAKLEPVNPYIFTEIGRVYLFKSDLFFQQQKEAERTENLKLAQENFEKAIKLKSDYAPAHFLVAMVYVRENKIGEAIEKLEATKPLAMADTGLAFQLGLLYYNNNQLDKAKDEFIRAVSYDPNYSNARYFLGLIYDRQGNKKEAILQFERIAELNPDNEEVKRILANLRANKPALEEVAPGQPPVKEKPTEQLEK